MERAKRATVTLSVDFIKDVIVRVLFNKRASFGKGQLLNAPTLAKTKNGEKFQNLFEYFHPLCCHQKYGDL